MPWTGAPGLTLPELVFTLAIAAGLLGWGVAVVPRPRAATPPAPGEVNQFVQAVYLARSEAIKRNGVVSLCPSRDGARCAPPARPGRRAGSSS